MTIDMRIIAVALLAIACKGAENARAKTPSTASAEQSAPATAAAPAATTSAPSTDPLVARADSGRIRGNPSAKIWMILASDFQCPYCKMWHDSSDMTIRRDYIDNGKVRLAFVNYPIGSHQNAIPAAEYAMCAAAQNKFWQTHDALFASQEKWAALPDPAPLLEQAATSAGVDLTALRSCVSSHKMRPLIEADREKASQAGVRATPSFFVNNQLLEGVVPTAELKKALDAALASVGEKQ
jgi:protein-disulfide isomerase